MRSLVKFFSSVKLAIVLIILITIASVVGTLIPQNRGAAEYAARYGGLAGFFTGLGLTTLYRSAWYLGLLILFALNTVVCTLTRLGPKGRRAFGPARTAAPQALAAMRPNVRFRLPGTLDEARARVTAALRDRRYRLDAKAGEGRIDVLARKRRLGWFGSDVVHLGLLVVLAGGLASGLGGRRADLALVEGQTAGVPRAAFQVRLDKFETEYYPKGGVKDWKSRLTVVEGGADVLTRVVEVNEPLRYKGYSFYQSGYGTDWNAARLDLEIRRRGDPAFVKPLTVRTGVRTPVDDPGVTSLLVRRFVPDFVLGEGNQVRSRSEEPRNPAALVEAWKGEERIFAGWIFAKYPDFGQGHAEGMKARMTPGGQAAGAPAPPIAVVLKAYAAAPYSVLEAAYDPGAGLVWLGCALVTAGFFLAFYWPPREIRIALEETRGGTELAAGGHAAKGRDAFQAEFEALFRSVRRPE
ncbi:MAG TPA: cytochrome c biogenesis protein ResB [Candidatus Aminicenantes bacterium]|nr:cytochrome c biogenesis protein ResB [Candidatus Aminicenantes bacterium]HRY65938.1 cytochrome c biogenesis protein ResB [Candidatus Aminicenantes bacterium]HRZ72736.1 cytochrome c biogenesis protein ResB [Candidatus Aminicenantes bacterium]